MQLGLKAISADFRISRYYNIEISMDLFSQWSLKISHGRTGSRARMKQHSFTCVKAMVQKLELLLRRRLTSSRRIGCDYRLVWLRGNCIPEVSRVINGIRRVNSSSLPD